MSETENIKSTEPTVAPVEGTTEDTGKNFSQADMDKVVSDRISRVKRQYDKKYEGVDVETYHDLIQRQEKEQQEQLKSKGEFEKILKAQADKKDSQIDSLLSTVKSIKVDGALLDTAAKLKAVNPQQVVTLLKDNVRIDKAGQVEIVDPKTKQVRYNDKGEHLSIENLVSNFLTANSHFVAASPSGSGTESKLGDTVGTEKLDISKLDMQNVDDRKLYAEYRKAKGIS